MTTCPETLLSGSLPTTLTETDGQKMIEKKGRSAATDSFAVPRFCPRLFCRTKWVCLSIPFRRQTRKKDGEGGEEKKGETEGGGGRSPVAVVCRPTGKKEGRKLHVGEEARTKVSCPRFLSPMLSLQKVPTPRRAATRSQRARQTTSRLICHLQQGG